jgi:hypothetical protein
VQWRDRVAGRSQAMTPPSCISALRASIAALRESDLLAPSRVGSPRGPRSHDGTIIPETVDTM